MELLEAPQLMDTFIRNGYYEDAMELQSHIQKLLIRHPEIKLLKRIAAEISGGTSLMLQQLTHLLRSSISFPLCIRVIGYLRKMEAFAEPELRLLFLQQRGSFLKRTLADIKSSDHSEHLKKYLEITRVHFFDIITQYKRIFSDSNTIYTSTTSRQSYLSDFPVTVSTQSILSSFVLNFLDEFMQEIEIHVPKLRDANIINSIYTQATFFGTSLSNIGIDFSHAISSVFESTVFGIFQDIINDGIQEFIDWTLVDGNQFHAKNQFSDELTAATSTTTTTTPVSSAGSNPNSLQLTLNRLQLYPSLAFILNKYYYAFNQIRILPSARLIDSSRNLVQESLITISTRISKIAKSVPESEMVDYREACRFFSELLVPIVVDGLVRIFSEAIQNSEQVIRSKIEIRRIIAPLESSKRLD